MAERLRTKVARIEKAAGAERIRIDGSLPDGGFPNQEGVLRPYRERSAAMQNIEAFAHAILNGGDQVVLRLASGDEFKFDLNGQADRPQALGKTDPGSAATCE